MSYVLIVKPSVSRATLNRFEFGFRPSTQATSYISSVIQVGNRFAAPLMTIEQTPSFATVPGQMVLLHAIANSQADINSIPLTVNGQLVTLYSQSRATYTPTTPSRLIVEATATDADGWVGRTSSILKVRDPLDQFAPVVSLDLT